MTNIFIKLRPLLLPLLLTPCIHTSTSNPSAPFIFGGEIIKGAGNAAKGFTRVHQVEEGAHLFRQGQKIQKAHQEAHLLEEGIKAGAKGSSFPQGQPLA